MHTNKLVLTLAMLLSGCTTTFTHTTQAPAEFDRELYGCQRDAAPVQDRARSIDMIERCMAIKGWRKNGFAWGFNRYAPIRAQSSEAEPVDAFRRTRSAIGATKVYGGGLAGSPDMQPNEPAPIGGATGRSTVRSSPSIIRRDEPFEVPPREASSILIDN